MKIEYTMKEGFKPDKETIKVCDDGARGFQSVMVEVGKIAGWRIGVFVWILTRFYKRIITDNSIVYDFYLFNDVLTPTTRGKGGKV